MPGNDYYTSTLLHFDGTNGSSVITQSSSSAYFFQISPGTANVALSALQSKFGPTSLLVNGSSTGGAFASDAAGFQLTGDFTIDWWLRLSTLTPLASNVGQAVFGNYSSNSVSPYVGFVNASSQMGFYSASSAGNATSTYDIANNVLWGTPNTSAWDHWAVTRASSIWRLFQNGTINNTFTSTLTPFVHNDFFVIGTLFIPTAGNQWSINNGYIDEFRVTQGLARWTANFTPPTTPYDEWEPGFDAKSYDWITPPLKVAPY